MRLPRPDSLKGQTVLVTGVCLLLFHVVSLVLYIVFSASTVTLEKEEQIADRIITITRLIEHAKPSSRAYLAGELSGQKFRISIEDSPLVEPGEAPAGTIIGLIAGALHPVEHRIAAHYDDPADDAAAHAHGRNVVTQRLSGMFRIHESLLVSIDLPDGGNWLNFRVSGSAWDHIFSLEAIPSLTLMTLAAILFTAWAVNRPLKSLSRFARASHDMGINILTAEPIDESGPREIREAARAFNQMLARVRRLLEARNQMLGALSHDFRTPLTRLRLRVESMTDERQKAKAVADLDEMEEMIRLTLAFARDEAAGGARETVDLAAAIRGIVEGFDDAATRVSIDTPASLAAACQPLGIRRVLANILGNALFYAGQVRIGLRGDGANILIDVDDDGPGIEPRERERVFLPFYRLESSRNRETGGAGLGLSIAQTIVHAHGGTISLLDSPMGGLRVRIVLPRGPESVARTAE
jgi:signal transduction histidine kinase